MANVGRTKSKYTRFYYDGYDLSGFSRSIGPLTLESDEADLTANMSDTVKGYQKDMTHVNIGTLNAVFDNTAVTGLIALVGGEGVGRVVTIPVGTRAAPVDGDPCFGGSFMQGGFQIAEDGGAVTVTVPFQGWYNSASLSLPEPRRGPILDRLRDQRADLLAWLLRTPPAGDDRRGGDRTSRAPAGRSPAAGRGPAGLTLIACLGLTFLPGSTSIYRRGGEIGWPAYKLVDEAVDVSRAVVSLAPPGVMLASREISGTTPMLRGGYPQLRIRDDTLVEWLTARDRAGEADLRIRASEFTNGEQEYLAEFAQLVESTEVLETVVLREDVLPLVDSFLMEQAFSHRARSGRYLIL